MRVRIQTACRCGHQFLREANVYGDWDPPDRPQQVQLCEVCTSAPFKTLKQQVADLEAQLKTLREKLSVAG